MAAKTVLGLDLGSNSVGWALIRYENDRPKAVTGCGVRVFEAGVEGQIERGRDKSRGVERRMARQRRRQTDRRSRRLAKVATTLQKHGLLPAGDVWKGKSRHELIKQLDNALYDEYRLNGSETDDALDQLPYLLRRKALDDELSPHAAGRALYHLAQRRGFLSNRKSASKDEDEGVVNQAIGELRERMAETGARTLGEYLSKVDPIHERRLRGRWTARSMYQEEFEAIWEKQHELQPEAFTKEAERELIKAIFDQRPLKSQKGLVGKCECEPQKRRAPWAILPAQEFRIRDRVNNMRLLLNDGTDRALTPLEREIIYSKLNGIETAGFPSLRKAIKAPTGAEFNLERGGEKKLKGNVTGARIQKAIHKHWDRLTDQQKKNLIGELMGIDDEETVARRAREVYGIDAESGLALAKVRLERAHCRVSREAMRKLLPRMREGTPFATAKNEIYGEDGRVRNVLDKLPALKKSGVTIRNPAVERTLTEMRKVVNAIIREYGKPDEIRIELARDLKQPRQIRKERWQNMRKQEKARADAAQVVIKETGNPNPTRADVEKVLLAMECNRECPFTGRSIGWAALLGPEPQFDVEHIIPRSRWLDKSYMNKTICYHEFNRNRKRNKTPFEAFSGDAANYELMLERVKRFTGDAARAKLKKFRIEEVPDLDEFARRQLNDTRYASKEAAKYLSWLYADPTRTIQATTGQLTSDLRYAWRLNEILSDGNFKQRDDHRHHAIDAIVTALTDRSMVMAMAEASASQYRKKGRSRGWEKLVEEPWTGFYKEVQEAIENITVSHRVSRKVQGRLHKDTNYSQPRLGTDGDYYVAWRKPLDEKFGQKEIRSIADSVVREVVQRHYDLHGRDSKKAFSEPAHHPKLGRYAVHRVRVLEKTSVMPVGSSEPRFVVTDTNHHVAIYEVQDARGRLKWTYEMVSLKEAHDRLRGGTSIVARSAHEEGRFQFSLAPGELLALQENSFEALYVARTVSKGNIEMCRIEDARKKEDIKKEGDWIKRSVGKLRELNACKVSVDPLGKTTLAHD